MKRIRGAEGFSLIEIIIALVIFGIGVLGLAGLVPLATQSLNRGAGATRAHSLALAKMEELENASGTTLLTEGVSADTLDGTYVRRWEITEDAPMTGMTTISVEVLWREGEDLQRLALSTSLLSGAQ